ncbi:MAG: hypothetical protein OXU61_11625 [Gammaproteobacteria bacterium]|nr:hypothetical protein [Gammaproteobacteria bacterium]
MLAAGAGNNGGRRRRRAMVAAMNADGCGGHRRLRPASGHSSARCCRSSGGVRQALQCPSNWVLDKS